MSLITILENLFIGPLKLLFEIIFVIAERVIGSPGLAIIALSLVINVLMLPLHRRADVMQEEARDKEAKLRDGVAHIKKTFAGDERMMILQTYYRQNDYRPTDVLNGSVSLLLEVPFFMAAYQFLANLTMLNGKPLGPIADLGTPDGMLVIGTIVINVLPILMTLINILSGAIYSKGFPLKTKLQMYGLALLFLVVLYDSPSGLVFYWTLNNLFSLVKNIWRRSSMARKAGSILCFATGAALMIFGVVFYHPLSAKRKLLVVGIGMALMLLVLWGGLKGKLGAKVQFRSQPNRKLFLVCSVFLTVLTGMLIPSTYIAASAQEYIDVGNYYDPRLYVLMATCLAAGTFLVWMRIFYWLASPSGKALFDKAVFLLCGVMLVNYMFFGRDLGILNSSLQYVVGMKFTTREELLNLAVLLVLALVMLILVCKWERKMVAVMLTAAIALGSMSVLNLVTIRKDTSNVAEMAQTTDTASSSFPLSREGKNVVVIMLDRAPGYLIPYILNEKPELKEKFDGFVFYENTISYGKHTVFGTPALYGGYEYTPVEMNKRDTETLVEKHNEALKVMPVLFSENGFRASTANPPFANYQWIPDVSIFDEYPQINAFITDGLFADENLESQKVEANNRNFFCFSIMKGMPVILQETLYNGGTYNQAISAIQTTYSMSEAKGMLSEFLKEYRVLDNMDSLTQIVDGEENTFLFLSNAMTHEPMLLQEPSYTPAEHVDNRAYDAANTDRFRLEDRSLTVETAAQMSQYHINMSAMLLLADWFDYLRENDIYDNTRIIIAADHGWNADMVQQLQIQTGAGSTYEVAGVNPVLLVKDFDSTGFYTSDAFMTNADVISLAAEGLIEDPVNPFTGKQISSSEKYAHAQYITWSSQWEVLSQTGNTYLPDTWASVEDDLWDAEQWAFSDVETVLKEHVLP